jgi:ubiquinone/menaquinone biosynthesis C-methylase UbiE
MPTTPPQDENTYFIDAESGAETARLLHQDRLITRHMGGIFPERLDLSNVHDVLDIGCGPGGWVLDVAYAYPGTKVVGIDISRTMVQYARAMARVQLLDNASFEVMDATKPLDFPDNSFDFVNARFIFAFMPTGAWPKLTQECMRITRSGGIIRFTEFDVYGVTNSPACEKFTEWGSHAFKLAGQSFSPDGRGVGLTPMLGHFLRDGGCINIEQAAHVIDFSAGTEEHETMRQNSMVVFKLMQPFLLKTRVATQEEMDRVYEQMLAEMLSDDFCGTWFYLSVWGQKPA